eukprot:2155094-Amphidinium_carterae.1
MRQKATRLKGERVAKAPLQQGQYSNKSKLQILRSFHCRWFYSSQTNNNLKHVLVAQDSSRHNANQIMSSYPIPCSITCVIGICEKVQ